MHNLDNTPRYAPSTVMTLKGERPVLRYIAHSPENHPEGCPLHPALTALELQTCADSRWYGVEKAHINSELRMVVQGFSANFEEMAAWEKVPQPNDTTLDDFNTRITCEEAYGA